MEFRKLRADEIDVRIQSCTQKGAILLLYKDARVDQNILDETVGAMFWQRQHTRDNQNCIVSIWNKEIGQWVHKEDTGSESNTEKEKGLASDSFKRACFNWGIGRELYTTGLIWVNADKMNLKESQYNGKTTYKCNDKFIVKSITYDSFGNIQTLEIYNETKKVDCFKKTVPETESQKQARIEKEEKEKLAFLEKQKADELALHGKLVHDLNALMGDNTDMFDKSIIKMNKTFKTEYKGFGEFSNVQLQQYINYLNKQKNKDLENMVNRVDEREEK